MNEREDPGRTRSHWEVLAAARSYAPIELGRVLVELYTKRKERKHTETASSRHPQRKEGLLQRACEIVSFKRKN